VVADSLTLMRALGYDMNSMEWAIRGGVPYAIDFMNPAPDMDIYSLTPHYFGWAVEHMADMAIRLAKNPRPQRRELRWDRLFLGRRQEGADLATVAPVPAARATLATPAATESAAARPRRGGRRKPATPPSAGAPTSGSIAETSATGEGTGTPSAS
jgi:hypothetical protein